MANSYYECHITMLGDPKKIRPEVERCKWKFSVIDGDPVLGEGVKCYATHLFNRKHELMKVQAWLFDTAAYLSSCGFEVLRRKIELVIFDDRSVKINCTGGCVDCHLDDLCSIND